MGGMNERGGVWDTRGRGLVTHTHPHSAELRRVFSVWKEEDIHIRKDSRMTFSSYTLDS